MIINIHYKRQARKPTISRLFLFRFLSITLCVLVALSAIYSTPLSFADPEPIPVPEGDTSIPVKEVTDSDQIEETPPLPSEDWLAQQDLSISPVKEIVKEVELADGTKATQYFDEAGKLQKQIAEDGFQTTLDFHYSEEGELVEVIKTYGAASLRNFPEKVVMNMITREANARFNSGVIDFYRLNKQENADLEPGENLLAIWVTEQDEPVVLAGRLEKRTLPDGTVQSFDPQGSLTSQVSIQDSIQTTIFLYYADEANLSRVEKRVESDQGYLSSINFSFASMMAEENLASGETKIYRFELTGGTGTTPEIIEPGRVILASWITDYEFGAYRALVGYLEEELPGEVDPVVEELRKALLERVDVESAANDIILEKLRIALKEAEADLERRTINFYKELEMKVEVLSGILSRLEELLVIEPSVEEIRSYVEKMRSFLDPENAEGLEAVSDEYVKELELLALAALRAEIGGREYYQQNLLEYREKVIASQTLEELEVLERNFPRLILPGFFLLRAKPDPLQMMDSFIDEGNNLLNEWEDKIKPVTEEEPPVVQAPLVLIQNFTYHPFSPFIMDTPSYQRFTFRTEGLPRQGVLILSRDASLIPEIREGEKAADIAACRDSQITFCLDISQVDTAAFAYQPKVIRTFQQDANTEIILSAGQLLMVDLPFGGFTAPEYQAKHGLPENFPAGQILEEELALIESVLKEKESRDAVVQDLAGRLGVDSARLIMAFQRDVTFTRSFNYYGENTGEEVAIWDMGLNFLREPETGPPQPPVFVADFREESEFHFIVRVYEDGTMKINLLNPEAVLQELKQEAQKLYNETKAAVDFLLAPFIEGLTLLEAGVAEYDQLQPLVAAIEEVKDALEALAGQNPDVVMEDLLEANNVLYEEVTTIMGQWDAWKQNADFWINFNRNVIGGKQGGLATLEQLLAQVLASGDEGEVQELLNRMKLIAGDLVSPVLTPGVPMVIKPEGTLGQLEQIQARMQANFEEGQRRVEISRQIQMGGVFVDPWDTEAKVVVQIQGLSGQQVELVLMNEQSAILSTHPMACTDYYGCEVTIKGLTSNTKYSYFIQISDNGQVIKRSVIGEFQTLPPVITFGTLNDSIAAYHRVDPNAVSVYEQEFIHADCLTAEGLGPCPYISHRLQIFYSAAGKYYTGYVTVYRDGMFGELLGPQAQTDIKKVFQAAMYELLRDDPKYAGLRYEEVRLGIVAKKEQPELLEQEIYTLKYNVRGIVIDAEGMRTRVGNEWEYEVRIAANEELISLKAQGARIASDLAAQTDLLRGSINALLDTLGNVVTFSKAEEVYNDTLRVYAEIKKLIPEDTQNRRLLDILRQAGQINQNIEENFRAFRETEPDFQTLRGEIVKLRSLVDTVALDSEQMNAALQITTDIQTAKDMLAKLMAHQVTLLSVSPTLNDLTEQVSLLMDKRTFLHDKLVKGRMRMNNLLERAQRVALRL